MQKKFFLPFAGLLILSVLLHSMSLMAQIRKIRTESKAGFDSSVFRNPDVIKSYIDKTGKQAVEIRVPGILPGVYKMPAAQVTDAAVILNSVPAYDWSFGCSATAAAMMAGYYDRNGYPDMYNGPANGGLAPLDNSIWGQATINGEVRSLCPLSATRAGLDGRLSKGHVDDFWIFAGNNDPDPYIGNWTAHTYGDCTGDFMKTNQSEFGNSDGSTIYAFYVDGSPFTGTDGGDGQYGLRLFFESRGYDVFSYYSQYIVEEGHENGFSFEDYMNQIDHGRPVLIQLAGHTVLGIGYDAATQKVYLHDTWDYNLREMNWGTSYADLHHYAVGVMELLPQNAAILSVTPPNLTVGWQPGSALLDVISNRTWTVSESSDWISVNPSSGTGNGAFTLNYDENSLNTVRQAQFTVTIPAAVKDNGKEPGDDIPAGTVLTWEPFSGTGIPAGWQVQGLGQENWGIAEAGIAGSVPPLLKFNWEPQVIGISRMVTPVINTEGMTHLSLSFKQFVNRYDASFTIGVVSSGDGGSTWIPVWSQNITENFGPETRTIDITNATVGSTQFRLGFYFEGDTWNLWDWNIDNVLLENMDLTETLTIQQEANPSVTQSLTIPAGWSGVSLYLEPSNPAVNLILAPLGSNFVMLKNLSTVYYPAGSINTIGNWNINSGYIIKLNSGASLPVNGIVPSNKTTSLNTGWNLIPVLSSVSVNTASLFAPVSSKLTAVMEVAGNGIYWPQMNINTLPVLSPGKSYFVKVNAAATVVFP